MDLSQNLLIIGAGAHVPYGLPTGENLSYLIKDYYGCRLLNSVAEPMNGDIRLDQINSFRFEFEAIIKQMCKFGPDRDKYFEKQNLDRMVVYVDEFLNSFSVSSAYTIDSFLSKISLETDMKKRLAFILIGKALITNLILIKKKLNPEGSTKDDWIEHLLMFCIKKETDVYNLPKVITFNYDMTFERVIYNHLCHNYRLKQDSSISYVRDLSIRHVYGNIGAFDKVGEVEDLSIYKNAVKDLKIIGEDRHIGEDQLISEQCDEIKLRMKSATNIYFLGYGFDSANNKLLVRGLDQNWAQGKKIYSTSIGISEKDKARIERELMCPVTHADCTSLELLRDKYPLG